jgi:NAD-dependent dihydropyrimidine dehydrogenase PreA subunit
MSVPLWTIEVLKKGFRFRFFLAKLTRIPLVGKFIHDLCFKGDEIIYLPRDDVISVNRPLKSQNNVVLPSEIVTHFIEQSEFHWIMNFCLCRDSEACRDYPVNLGCLFLGRAVLGINPDLGRRASKEEALRHIQRCREAGLVHMIGRNRLDTLWLNIGPGDRLLTICNCCPCCCLWKMLPALKPSIGAKVTKVPGLSVTVTDRCVACGRCTEGICFVDAVKIVDGKARIGSECRGCGLCIDICPNGAIELTVNDHRFIAKSIAKIESLVDLT